jgi:hypothetical protein
MLMVRHSIHIPVNYYNASSWKIEQEGNKLLMGFIVLLQKKLHHSPTGVIKKLSHE